MPERDVTQMLQEWNSGNQEILNELLETVYHELRLLARSYLSKERSNHTLQPTALVNEAYLRLIRQRNVTWQNRAHFFGIAAQIMRRILIDHARKHLYAKRGGGAVKISLNDMFETPNQPDVELIALDDALKTLEEVDPQQCRIVELRFFGGLTIEETALVMGISQTQVKEEWNFAKAWLYRQMKRT